VSLQSNLAAFISAVGADIKALQVPVQWTKEFTFPGSLGLFTGQVRLTNTTGFTLTIQNVYIRVGTAPTGAAILVDVNKNGTTIFTTQANRPTIAISGTTSGKVTNMDVTTLADGDYLTFDIDQIGSTIAGSDLTFQVVATMSASAAGDWDKTFTIPGLLAVATGNARITNTTGRTLAIKNVLIQATTSPTGAAILVDINKNGTTIFTTQANRPTVAISGHSSGKVTNMDITSLADGDYISVDVDQIGSTIAGSDLTIQILAQ
jgi:hypothetical protein